MRKSLHQSVGTMRAEEPRACATKAQAVPVECLLVDQIWLWSTTCSRGIGDPCPVDGIRLVTHGPCRCQAYGTSKVLSTQSIP